MSAAPNSALPDSVPTGRTSFRTLIGAPDAEYFTYLPPAASAASPVVVLVHGITRNAAEHVFRFAAAADCANAILVAPLFTKASYGQYQQVVDGARGVQADLALFDMLTAVAAATGADTRRVHLFGFSGGAQFAHRFMMLHPERVAALAVAAAGWYSFPDPDLPYPFGIGSHPIPGGRFDAEQFLAIPRHVLVGDRDVARDEALRTGRRLDQLQGRNRLERARAWSAAMDKAAETRGIATRTTLSLLAGGSHSFTQAAERLGLPELAFRNFGILQQ
ncbi:MAG: hypothetical protein ACK4SZ_16430 [Allosphingosinicella sp.]|uniref:hypothetical protein n=1 Tax=Allosphingosinicella sp. TaxID=2823234 RepID=UPI003958CCCC